MSRVQVSESGVVLWASANDTWQWANGGKGSNGIWPCSTLEDHRFVAVFDANGLCDLTVDGQYHDEEKLWIDGHELSACCADLLAESGKVPEDHPCYFVAIGQFREA